MVCMDGFRVGLVNCILNCGSLLAVFCTIVHYRHSVLYVEFFAIPDFALLKVTTKFLVYF